MDTTAPGKLARKLATLVARIGKVPKSGRHDHFGYDYLTENDLVWAVRDLLADAGIFIFTSVESQKVENIRDDTDPAKPKFAFLTTVTLKHTLVDGESGEQFSVLSQGQGWDPTDKGVYKATTGAMKYFLYKCFLIPTGEDPEPDGTATPEERIASRNPPPKGSSGATPFNRAQFEHGEWKTLVVHFGQFQGSQLGELSLAQLSKWFFGWKPKPFNGVIVPADTILRLALDVAEQELRQVEDRR